MVPYDLSKEIINYYYKILELNGLVNFKERLHFTWPENHLVKIIKLLLFILIKKKIKEFPAHTSTSKLLLYSAKTLNRIKNLVKG